MNDSADLAKINGLFDPQAALQTLGESLYALLDDRANHREWTRLLLNKQSDELLNLLRALPEESFTDLDVLKFLILACQEKGLQMLERKSWSPAFALWSEAQLQLEHDRPFAERMRETIRSRLAARTADLTASDPQAALDLLEIAEKNQYLDDQLRRQLGSLYVAKAIREMNDLQTLAAGPSSSAVRPIRGMQQIITMLEKAVQLGSEEAADHLTLARTELAKILANRPDPALQPAPKARTQPREPAKPPLPPENPPENVAAANISEVPAADTSMDYMPALVPQTISGVYHGIVMLTPQSVLEFKNPWPWEARAKLKVNLDINSETLFRSGNFKAQDQVRPAVYRGGLRFPELCPVTLAKPVTNILAEYAVNLRSLGKVSFNAQPEETARIINALTTDRFWFSIPFSLNHGIEDRAIGFIAGKHQKNCNQAVILLKNRIYAREFARLNRLANGKWLTMKHQIMKGLGILAGITGLGLLAAYVLALSSNLSIATGQPLLVGAGLLLFAAGITLFVIGERGEPL